jgi:hypothetical protein
LNDRVRSRFGLGARGARHAAAPPRAPALPLLLLAALLAALACGHGAAAARVTLASFGPAAAPAPAAAVAFAAGPAASVATAASATGLLAAPRPSPPPPLPSRLARSMSRGAPVPVPIGAAAGPPITTPKLINAGAATSHVASFAFGAAVIAAIVAGFVLASGTNKPRAPVRWNGRGDGVSAGTSMTDLLSSKGAAKVGAAGMTVGERMRLLKEAQLAEHQYNTMPPVPPPPPPLRGPVVMESASL